MRTVAELVAHARDAQQPSGQAPWPDLMDVPRWLWTHATPEFWRDQYPAEPDLSTYLINPGVWGVTDQMYASRTDSDAALLSGWTMGDGGRFELRTVPRASEGYLLWQAMMQPLQMARDIIDRTPARLDALQAPDDELPRLAKWARLDPLVASGMPLGLLRRYVRFARAIERVRGTERMEEPLSQVLGAPVEITWDTDEPFKRVVAVYGQTGPHTKQLIRRNLPPHIGVELLTIIGFSGYTGGLYTAKVPSGLPHDSLGYTASQRVTAELI